ncbi:hypothetical protein [Microbacterium halotolerans]|uniref:hypothetical protein n=1 Tax=Microbacterium halotolerans TaxID=246613 RepID=UPI000E6AE174|nr:hypothetical protein [Microbacterium halotolerans]
MSSPDELRAAADSLLTRPEPGRLAVTVDARDAGVMSLAARRLARVIEHVESERVRLPQLPAASMYAQGEFDAFTEVARIARGETTSHEERRRS